ncbi:hypothetical protein B0O80DRAFT_437901 [Mortierella sp. GBAus27b]|nr:hypothetical protein B0O80DRAFT_437901 [Mortierella sp. GBAus27b]
MFSGLVFGLIFSANALSFASFFSLSRALCLRRDSSIGLFTFPQDGGLGIGILRTSMLATTTGGQTTTNTSTIDPWLGTDNAKYCLRCPRAHLLGKSKKEEWKTNI